MRRREFIALGAASILSGAGLAPAARAQQPGGRKRVGLLLTGGNPDGTLSASGQAYVDAVRAGLKDEGFVDGTNAILDVRLALNDLGVMRTAARDFAGGGYDVLIGAATPGTAALLAETKTIPIVFASASDPLGSGFVQSFAHPGGNVTGFTNFEASIAGKWLDMLRQVAPGVRRAVMMFNPDTSPASFFLPSFQAAATARGIATAVAEVRSLAEIDAAVADMGRTPETGLVVGSDGYVLTNRQTVIDAVARQNLPAVYPYEEFAADGGLIAYAVDLVDIYRRAGGYVGLILKGARPGELPVQAPTKFVLSVNLKTAKAQGITIPTILVALADEVIQ